MREVFYHSKSESAGGSRSTTTRKKIILFLGCFLKEEMLHNLVLPIKQDFSSFIYWCRCVFNPGSCGWVVIVNIALGTLNNGISGN